MADHLCQACLSPNKSDRRFCGHCGAALGCRDCGFINEPAATFCGGCGVRLAEEPADHAKDLTESILGFEMADLIQDVLRPEASLPEQSGGPDHMDQSELDELFN